ncbi:hypothetical protein [Caulobacter hibisci]|uniref:Uncharacterized protein n=1 Tax=Caulobacter hibisci TaxID=2035993 RepID=A0ABS0SRV7_9CAUL|nr:hypothetical protein [Caulobacter hibisci]MBI1682332.1 hypothetical protein [Caulobacter hibisci]
MSDQNKGSSQSQPVSAPESAARNSSASMDMSKTTTPDLAARVGEAIRKLKAEHMDGCPLYPVDREATERLYRDLLDAYAEQTREIAAIGDLQNECANLTEAALRDAATIAALTAEVERLKGQASQASTLIRVAMNTEDADAKTALIHAALDFASDDTEALAEGAKWAPVDLTAQGEG